MNKDLKDVKSKSYLSAFSLLAQGSYAAVLGFVAFSILTLKSGAYLLGIYNTVLAALSSFNYFTNLGLSAAIMQKKEVTQEDLSTTFYIQTGLSIIGVVIGLLCTSAIFRLYPDLTATARPLYWAVLLSFLTLSLRTVPSILLEKKLEIYKVVLVQGIENTVFYVAIIVMVLMGFDITSLVVAVLARAVVGTVLMFWFNPWMPSLTFSMKSAKQLLRYGIPFQGNSFLALIKDDLLVLYMGSAIGLSNLGLVMFGKKYAEFSIRLIMDNINRVAFPLFAQFQDSKDLLKKSLKKVLFYDALFIFPVIIGAIFVFDKLVFLFPEYYTKWHPALFSFFFFSLSALFVSLYSPLISFFNAIGKVKISVGFMVYFTIFSWVAVPFAIKMYGYNGISVTFFIMSLSFFFVQMWSKKYIKYSFLSFVSGPLYATAGMAVWLILIRLTLADISVKLYLIASIIGGAGIYSFIMYRLGGDDLLHEVRQFFSSRK